MRDWTPGVEPCAETKSSRHCHLGRDSRFLYPLASLHCMFLFVYPLPLVRLLFPSSYRFEESSPSIVGDRLIRNLSPLFGNCPRPIFLSTCSPFPPVSLRKTRIFSAVVGASRKRRATRRLPPFLRPCYSRRFWTLRLSDGRLGHDDENVQRGAEKETVAKERVRETILRRERSHVPESLLPSGQPTNA